MSRLKFATDHVIWTKEQWDSVHFSYESNYKQRWIWGRKYDGVWQDSAAGSWPLERLYGKINATLFKEILKNYAVPNLRTAINQPAVFMWDNAPCHTPKSVKPFLSEEDVTIMKWSAQSPDMNPIENVWKLLNERAKEKNPRNVEWTNLKISVDVCMTLIRSCTKRCQAVIESKGLHIKY